MSQVILGKERRSLKVDLTTEERIALGSELAKAMQQWQNTEREKTEVAAQYKADIEKHRADAAKVSQTLANGYEHREVECTLYALPDCKVQVVRTDTLEEVQVRDMTDHERQQALPLPGDAEDKTPILDAPTNKPQ